jgi:GTP diphosphokinase / guanosine-3',5'-bis(diphosphate) 3'-diphosphatase
MGEMHFYGEDDKVLIQRDYRKLLKSIKATLDEKDKKDIRAAFELAAKAHQEQRRKSGEPYITHPIAVARICAEEIGLGATAIICALLHDVVEDTSIELEEIREQFGNEVANIVDGLTKLDSLHESVSPQAENITKVLRAMTSDSRVVLVKMADRLHNLRTIGSMPAHKQIKIAAETMEIYAPLAHRLGLSQVKTEFQDTCLKITHEEEYRDIARKLAEKKADRQQFIAQFIQPIEECLAEYNVKARVFGRPKSIFSIWNKIKTKNVTFEEIYDLFAIRIVVEALPDKERMACWMAYTAVTQLYQPIAERLKDWISTPKPNGYESLHTTLLGPGGRYVEVQIRSDRMDEIAELGIAAHWKYKKVSKTIDREDLYDAYISQVREALDNNMGDAVDFLTDFRSMLFSEGVIVYTPKGDPKVLPEGATALDFAFSIHSDVGCMCQSVRVQNRLVPINYKLRNGDQVTIITNKAQKPTEDWLKFVVTARAKNKIKQVLRADKMRLAEEGKGILERSLHFFKVNIEENVDMLARFYRYPNRMEFLSAIYLEQFDPLVIRQRFHAEGGLLILNEEVQSQIVVKQDEPGTVNTPAENRPKAKTGQNANELIINDEPGSYYAYTFATCCNPVQGESIFAFVGAKDGTKIHRIDCKNANFLYANYDYRILKADWGNTVKSDFVANLVVTGLDNGPGVINRITDKLLDMGINVRSLSIEGDAGYFEGRIAVVISNQNQLNQIIRALKTFDFVSQVRRE